MLRIHLVEPASRVTSVRVSRVVFLGEPGVALVALEVGVAELQLEAAVAVGYRFPGELQHGLGF